ncbi:hypothetical protein [Halorussus lipolyticus]|uniref:hypothetical protein n=1 Tax=Halorussus lipolyticus TaxID=3034024 RepID=UPI0023E76C47|nr:hypothetical protein [Halorussus sp. DT80]
MSDWAEDFYEIQDVVVDNSNLRNKIVELVNDEPIHGKAFEGGNRTESFREILVGFFEGEMKLEESIKKVSIDLPEQESRYSGNGNVFPRGWDERLIRTQASRFYNQAVLLTLKERGDDMCHIPHSSEEDRDSACTRELAGREVEIEMLLDRLERTYQQADYHNKVKIPNHPHCTHTIVPISE